MNIELVDTYKTLKNSQGIVTLKYLKYGPVFYKVYEVILYLDKYDVSDPYYFFEAHYIDVALDKTPDYFNSPEDSLEIDNQVAISAINDALTLESIALVDIDIISPHQESHENWFRTYNITTNVGVLTIGYGYSHGEKTSMNLLTYWPHGMFVNMLREFDISNCMSTKKNILFSLIGIDTILNISSPAYLHINPLDSDYHKLEKAS